MEGMALMVTDTLVPVQHYSLRAIMLVCGHRVIWQPYQQLRCPLCRRWVRVVGRAEKVTLR